MAGNITLTMIKPTAVTNGTIGPILSMINKAGFRISAMRFMRLSPMRAEEFYAIHKDRPFFNGLVEFMTSGPIVAAVLEKENAVEEYRKLIGPTNPENATDGTVRKIYGTSLQANAVHGSDSDENANIEADFFFSKMDRF